MHTIDFIPPPKDTDALFAKDATNTIEFIEPPKETREILLELLKQNSMIIDMLLKTKIIVKDEKNEP